MIYRVIILSIVLLVFMAANVSSAAPAPSKEHPLSFGWANADITPPKPVALVGQLHKRISKGVRDPLTATVLALETKGDAGQNEQAVMVSCDLLFIQRSVQQRLQQKVKAELPDFDSRKLFLNATHTHDGPGFIDSTFKGLYDVSKNPGVMKASEYADFFIDRVLKAVVQAWRSRKPGAMSWAMGHAMVGFNRRVQYFGGASAMYGDTASSKFSHIEGHTDPSVGMIFLWTADGKLAGLVINIACSSQETEDLHELSADFWHDVRVELRRRYGKALFILPQCAAAGDQSPHPLYQKMAEQVMTERRGLSRRQEIARRIAAAVDDVLPVARVGVKSQLVFRHLVISVDLPEQKPSREPFYETDSVHPIEFHVLRLGDVAIATDPFELYIDYGTRIQARSRAVLTLTVELSCGASGYLPTERAVKGGGYSADKFLVGPAGGQVLVEETVRQINGLFP